MMSKFRLVAALLLGMAALVSSVSITTAPPASASEFCRTCASNADCSGYALDSTCAQGQCTNNDGLLSRNCLCDDASECSTGRCSGIFQKRCHLKLPNTAICTSKSDCISGWCGDGMVCADPPPATDAPTAKPKTATPKPLPFVTANPQKKDCDLCLTNTDCGVGTCFEGVCTDESGELPASCGYCKQHSDCFGGAYYCANNGLIGSTGRVCEPKKRNGGSCINDDVCRSGHCNLLFKCESKIPQHKRQPEDIEMDIVAVTPAESSPSTGIAMWGIVFAALLLLGFFIFLMCRKSGFKKRWCGRKTKKRGNDTHTCGTTTCGDLESHACIDSVSNANKSSRLDSINHDEECHSCLDSEGSFVGDDNQDEESQSGIESIEVDAASFSKGSFIGDDDHDEESHSCLTSHDTASSSDGTFVRNNHNDVEESRTRLDSIELETETVELVPSFAGTHVGGKYDSKLKLTGGVMIF